MPNMCTQGMEKQIVKIKKSAWALKKTHFYIMQCLFLTQCHYGLGVLYRSHASPKRCTISAEAIKSARTLKWCNKCLLQSSAFLTAVQLKGSKHTHTRNKTIATATTATARCAFVPAYNRRERGQIQFEPFALMYFTWNRQQIALLLVRRMEFSD